MDDPFESIDALNHLEESFYASGHADGFAHGAQHGLFEGRALGKEKAFELWEEVGYYEGVASFWRAVLERSLESGMKEPRALTNVNQLLNLVSLFPTTNASSSAPAPAISPSNSPSPAAAPDPSSTSSSSDSSSSAVPFAPVPPEVDLAALLERIRARYKLTCSSLGIRPRLTVSRTTDADDSLIAGGGGESGLGAAGGAAKGIVVVNGVEVRSKELLF